MNDFDTCLERRSLVRIDVGPDASEREMLAAREELIDVEVLLANSRFKRATVSSYYAMFHAARALVLAKGYAEKSHYCLVVAFEALYGASDDGRHFAKSLARGRTMREHADYEGEFSEESARSSAAVAQAFVAFAETTLRKG